MTQHDTLNSQSRILVFGLKIVELLTQMNSIAKRDSKRNFVSILRGRSVSNFVWTIHAVQNIDK